MDKLKRSQSIRTFIWWYIICSKAGMGIAGAIVGFLLDSFGYIPDNEQTYCCTYRISIDAYIDTYNFPYNKWRSSFIIIKLPMNITKRYKQNSIFNMGKYSNSPLIEQRADPFIYKHTDGYYYFTGSVPSFDYIELRRSNTLDGLKNAETFKIWEKHNSGIMSQHIWAPEIHYLDGKWYIYFAASKVDDIWRLRPYVLECQGQNPLVDEWVELGQMQLAR
ncbi:MAG: family 43 glycosylhydrolase [Saprospiraceae bacterium]